MAANRVRQVTVAGLYGPRRDSSTKQEPEAPHGSGRPEHHGELQYLDLGQIPDHRPGRTLLGGITKGGERHPVRRQITPGSLDVERFDQRGGGNHIKFADIDNDRSLRSRLLLGHLECPRCGSDFRYFDHTHPPDAAVGQ